MADAKQQISFIHTADLHLGAPMLSMNVLDAEYSSKWKDIISTAVYDSFAKLVDTAIARNVDFFIVAGDVFDSKNVSYKDFTYFCNQMEKLNARGIQAFVIAGNHDPASTWQKTKVFGSLPENVHFFEPGKFSKFELQTKNFCNVVIGGQSFENAEAPNSDDFLANVNECMDQQSSNMFRIGILHTGLDIDLQNFAIEPKVLHMANIDYWALGHIHKNATYSMQNSTLSYPGCVQGLHINAKGADDENTKGAFGGNFVTISKDNFDKSVSKIEFVPTSQVLWKKIDIDISNCENINNVEAEILNKLEKTLQETTCPFICYRAKLCGSTNLHKDLDLKQNLENLKQNLNRNNNNCLCEQIINASKILYDYEKLNNQDLFASKILKVSQNNFNNLNEVKEYVINCLDNSKFSVDLDNIGNVDISEYLERAKEEALNLVLE